MKNIFLFLTVSAAALAVSADCQAMFRRASRPIISSPSEPRMAHPSLNFKRYKEAELQRALAHIITKQFPMPGAHSNKKDAPSLKHYGPAVLALARERVAREELKEEARKSLYWLPLMLCESEPSSQAILGLHEQFEQHAKNEKSLEAELWEILEEEKRLLRIPEDTQ